MRVEDAASRSKQEKSKRMILESLKKRTSYLLKKPVIEDADLYYYVKDFFKEYLDIDKELTFEEISVELDKTFVPNQLKKDIKAFLNRISEIEYVDVSFEEEDLKKYIEDFYKVAKALPDEEKKSESFIYRLLGKIGLKSSDGPVIDSGVKNKHDLNVSDSGEGVVNTSFDDVELKKSADFSGSDSANHSSVGEGVVENSSDNLKSQVDDDFIREGEGDVYDLLIKSKSIQDRDKLIELYKDINALYEKESVEGRAKIYPDLLELYEKIAKL